MNLKAYLVGYMQKKADPANPQNTSDTASRESPNPSQNAKPVMVVPKDQTQLDRYKQFKSSRWNDSANPNILLTARKKLNAGGINALGTYEKELKQANIKRMSKPKVAPANNSQNIVGKAD